MSMRHCLLVAFVAALVCGALIDWLGATERGRRHRR